MRRLSRKGSSFLPQPCLLAASRLKKPPHQFRDLGPEDAFGDFDLMVEDVGIGDAEFASDASEAEVSGSENKPLDARGHKRPGAHRARFERDV
jgi:hypothetical protein